jgi:hypothetical protein
MSPLLIPEGGKGEGSEGLSRHKFFFYEGPPHTLLVNSRRSVADAVEANAGWVSALLDKLRVRYQFIWPDFPAGFL